MRQRKRPLFHSTCPPITVDFHFSSSAMMSSQTTATRMPSSNPQPVILLLPSHDDSMVFCSQKIRRRLQQLHSLELQRIALIRNNNRSRARQQPDGDYRTTTTTTTARRNNNKAMLSCCTHHHGAKKKLAKRGGGGGGLSSSSNNKDDKNNSLSEPQLQQQQQFIVDPYQILQIRRDATRAEIRHAYRRLALYHHPARTSSCCCCNTDAAAVEQQHRQSHHVFTMAAAAYETLMDPKCRSRCDALLREMPVSERNSSSNKKKLLLGAGQVWVGNQAMSNHPYKNNTDTNTATTRDSSGFMIRQTASILGTSTDEEEEEPDVCGKARPQEIKLPHHRQQDDAFSCPRLADISLTDSDSDEEDNNDDETERHENLAGYSNGETATATTNNNSFNETLSPTLSLGIVSGGKVAISAAGGGAMMKSKKSCKQCLIDCGGGSSYDESLQLPALLNSTSTSEDAALALAEKHYTTNDTDRLFGGPLSLLFRARRWRPFTDAHVVFKSVFGSQLPVAKHKAALLDRTVPWSGMDRSPSHGEPWTRGTAERQPDGSVIFTRNRIFNQKRIVRKEVVRTDPYTGQKYSEISVESEPFAETVALPDKADEANQRQLCNNNMCISWNDALPLGACSFEGMLCGADPWFIP